MGRGGKRLGKPVGTEQGGCMRRSHLFKAVHVKHSQRPGGPSVVAPQRVKAGLSAVRLLYAKRRREALPLSPCV